MPGKDATVAAHVGTSGWQYRDWRGSFYPARLAQARWLEHYAAAFAVVEVNNTFYRLPERSTFEEWAARTPDDFLFAMKASRYLTHIRRLGRTGRAHARPRRWARPQARARAPAATAEPPGRPREARRHARPVSRGR